MLQYLIVYIFVEAIKSVKRHIIITVQEYNRVIET